MTSAYQPAIRPSYLTRRQAADHFGVSPKTIDRWIAAGKLDAVYEDGPRARGVTTTSVEALTAAQARS